MREEQLLRGVDDIDVGLARVAVRVVENLAVIETLQAGTNNVAANTTVRFEFFSNRCDAAPTVQCGR